MRAKDQEKLDALNRLREWVKPGDTIHTILETVSRSGMSRTLRIVKLQDSEPLYLTSNVAKALGYSMDKHGDALKIGGCGMDMGFAVVYALSNALFPDGFDCLGAGCPSNDHSNGDRDHSPHKHNSGAYALRHRWL